MSECQQVVMSVSVVGCRRFKSASSRKTDRTAGRRNHVRNRAALVQTTSDWFQQVEACAIVAHRFRDCGGMAEAARCQFDFLL